MRELNLYGSYQNGGDGSVYMIWFESEALAEWDQRHMYEGWGESCTEHIKIEGDNYLSHNLHIITAVEYYVSTVVSGYDRTVEEIADFISEFFVTSGMPKYVVKIEQCYGKYWQYMIYNNNIKVATAYCSSSNKDNEKMRAKIERDLQLGIPIKEHYKICQQELDQLN